MKKLVLAFLLALSTVASAQDLTLVCNGVEESKYRGDSEMKTKPNQYTYVFKNGKLTETTTAVAQNDVTWGDNYILVRNNSVAGQIKSIVIDRISGKVSDRFYSSEHGVSINFEGMCQPASRQF